MNCKHATCDQNTSGKSKYCRTHKAEARAAWKAMIAEKEQAKLEREQQFQEVWDAASAAAIKAGKDVNPEPMLVVQPSNPLDDNSPPVKQWLVPDGPCGFGWVNIKPGNSQFANWLKKNDLARKAYEGGVNVYIHSFGQSYDRKIAAAYAMAAEFKKADIKAYGTGRLD